MAVTSLAQQLSRLRVPQTSQLVDKKKKASFLFHSREAADIDRDTFYSIGIDGLSELISIDRNAFEQFENSLFDVSSKNFVRSIENTETNEKLNEEIKSFLINCSPYFLLKPTAQALEWMISRYQVNEYNIDSLFMLALPYYETKLFPRLLQLINLKSSPSWFWLQPVKKEGLPLSKTALFNRASTDMAFFKFVLDMPKTALQYYSGKPEQLSNLFAFFCTTIIGALNQTAKITELQVTHLLPAIKSGLTKKSSKVNDYTASVYMIVSFLLSKTRLSEMVVTELLFRVIKIFSKQRLINESILLMTLLCQCNAQVNMDSLTILFNVEKELMKSLSDTVNRGISIFPIIRAIFNSYLSLKQKKKTSNMTTECQNLVIKILDEIKFSKEEAEEVFRLFINKCKIKSEKQNKKVEFLVAQLKTLERRYPDAFDTIISDPKYSKTAKALFSLTPAYMGQMSLFNDLRHPNPAVRANAVKSVEHSFEPRESTWLSEVISERLLDENPLVVNAVLKLDTDFLISLLTKQRFVEHLMEAALKIWHENSPKWRKVVPRLLNQFCKAMEEATELRTERNVLLTVVPYLLSGNVAAARIVLEQSLLSDQVPFLKKLKNELKNIKDDDEARIVSSVWDVLQDQSSLPLLDVILQFQNLKFDVEKSLTMLLAASAIRAEIDPTKSTLVLDWLWAMIKDDKISLSKAHVSKDTIGKIMDVPRNGGIPLSVVHHLIVKLVGCTELRVPHDCQGWYKFDNPSQQFLLKMFKICSQIHQSMRKNYLKEFNHVTKQLFQTRLTKKEYGKLLCSMIMESKEVSEFCLLLLHDQLKSEAADNKEDRLWTVELSPSNLLVPVLLITLSSSNSEIRGQALSMIKNINGHCAGKTTPYSRFLKQLENWEEEMIVDCEQLFIALYMLLSPDPSVEGDLQEAMRQDMRKVRELLFDMITDPSTPLAVTSSLLSVLSHVSSAQIMTKLLPIGIQIFEKHSANANEVLGANENAIIGCILERVERSIVSVFEDEKSWVFVEKCLSMGKNGQDAPSVVFLNKITREFFDDLPLTARTKLIEQVVKIITEIEVNEVHSAASAMMKRISIDAATILNILHAMRDAQVATAPGQKAKKRWSQTPNYLMLGTNDWKRGVCLLELIQNKKKLTDSYRLIAPLFDILKVCLRFEEQGPVEYTKQLLLTTISLCLRKSAEEDKLKMLPPSAVPVESVVDCIRVSQNPQTHHHALSVLSLVAGLKPEEVLHNVMPVFTFMGSSVIRLDDAYSFQVTLKTVETIIPILVQSVDTGNANRDQIKEVLQVFAGAVLDIPEHRRLSLIHKLLITLDEDGGYLWLFICQVLASSVLEPEPRPPNSTELSNRKFKTLQDLCLEFSPTATLQAMHSIMKHVTSLPHDKESAKKSTNERYSMDTSNSNKDMDFMVFDVERNSGKQLRHYKYNLLNFISGLFSAEQFVSMMVRYNNGEMSDDERESLLLCFQQLVEGILGYMKEVSSQVDLTVNQPSAKYWKAMLNLIYDLLSKTNALLPSEMFLEVVGSLLPHKIPKMRRRVMELLNWQLQSSIPLAPEGLRSLLPTLLAIVRDRKALVSQEVLLNRQTALISIKLLARKIASLYPDDFQEALDMLTKLVQEGSRCETNEETAVTACAILCVAELLSCIGLKAIVQLPKFMPALMSILSATSATTNVPEFLLTSVITTLLKVLEYHSSFISPYLSDILMEVALISAKFEKQTDSKSDVVNLKINSVLTNISEKVPMRLMVPAIVASYSDLLEKREFAALPVVLSVLSSSSQQQHHLKSIIQSFLMKVLSFREEYWKAAGDCLIAVEKATVSCVIAHVLKLNEKEFHSFCKELVMRTSTQLKMITLFKVLQRLSETLKSLFLPFSKEFQSKVIDALNLKKNENRKRSAELLEATIGYLLNVFKYDNERSVTETYFKSLMPALVNQLENEICIQENLFDNLLIPCLANLAKCLSDDSLWKKFNYEILLKTQHENVKVRLAAVKAVCEVAKKLGDSYLPLLPESIPFLAELLEDEEEEVERTCRSVVQDMETVLGEQISKYFSK